MKEISIRCNEVIVKFKSLHRNGQILNYRDGNTKAKYLVVMQDETNLTVYYCSPRAMENGTVTNDPFKVVIFSFSDVAEYACNEIIQEPTAEVPANG